MSARRILLATTLVMLLVGAAVAINSFSRSRSLPAQAFVSESPEPSGSELISGYRSWTRVNPVPMFFAAPNAQACAILPAAQPGSPHTDKFITVYVNDIGKHAMMKEKMPHYPEGSVIVKEKLPSKESSAPELLTVMMKRAPGYNPENGDWEYMVFDGSGKSVQARGKLEKCQACHMMAKDRDYVSRNYLPNEIWEKLK
jgi:hypothetical protein